MTLFDDLLNLIARIKDSVAHSDDNLQEAKDYTDTVADTKLTNDLKLGSMEGAATVAGNANTWLTLTAPSGRKIIAPSGFYWYGSNNVNVMAYAYRQINDTQIQFALRNWGSSAATLTVYTQYLYIDEVGG